MQCPEWLANFGGGDEEEHESDSEDNEEEELEDEDEELVEEHDEEDEMDTDEGMAGEEEADEALPTPLQPDTPGAGGEGLRERRRECRWARRAAEPC
jgi:hypothetical protein